MTVDIITATYNSEAFIGDALRSVARQSYSRINHIIIDGLSNDATLDIIKSNWKENIFFSSEKDSGIYDALNKGIQLSKGDIVGILHSDDIFYNQNTIQNVMEVFKSNENLLAVYGDLNYVDRHQPQKIIRKWISGQFKRSQFVYGWMMPHPTLFMKRELYQKFGDFNLKYKSAADYDLILRYFYKNSIRAHYLPEVITSMRVGGLSNKSMQNRIRANYEDREAMKNNDIPLPLLTSIIKPLRKISQFF